jgi:HAD hydrolase, family IIB
MVPKILCITDLDGTFVKDSIGVSKADLMAYQLLRRFCDFAIATGRSTKEIGYITEKNKIDIKYYIAFNGALITDSQRNLIASNPIQKEDVEQLLQFLKKENLIFDALDGIQRIGNFSHEHIERLWNMKIVCPENPYDSLMDKDIYKFNIRPSKEQTIGYLNTLRETFPNLEIFQSGETRIEVTSEGVSKGSAIQRVSSDYDLLISFGDSGNDISLFQNSDISYCMSSAPEYVKKYADFEVACFSSAIEHLCKIIQKD